MTGSGILTRSGEVLLLRHKLLGIWVQPGGHLEDWEAPWDAARRETAEETGLDVRLPGDPAAASPLLHVDVHDAAHGHTHLDLRYALVVAGDATPRPPAGESQLVAWYPLAEAIPRADPGLRGLLVHLRTAASDPR
ncbi:MAG: NUDIX domain-containing protein [Acidimicrobiales bacterium]